MRKSSSAWYYRRRYPRDVAERLGRREFVQSLQTSNYAEALKLRPAAEAAYLSILCRVVAARADDSLNVRLGGMQT